MVGSAQTQTQGNPSPEPKQTLNPPKASGAGGVENDPWGVQNDAGDVDGAGANASAFCPQSLFSLALKATEMEGVPESTKDGAGGGGEWGSNGHVDEMPRNFCGAATDILDMSNFQI